MRLIPMLVLMTTVLLPLAVWPQSPSPSDTLKALLDEEWNYEMRTSPETATAYGDNRFNDRLSDFSPEFFAADVRKGQEFLAKFQAVSETGLSEQEQLNRSLMIRRLQDGIDGARFKPWEMQIDQFKGIHLSYGGLPTICPFNTVKDYENYIARLHQLPRVFDQVIANARQGMRDKLMPPKYLLEQVVPQARTVADNVSESNPFAHPVAKFPEGISLADQARLRKEVMAVVKDEIAPAYTRFAEFVQKD